MSSETNNEIVVQYGSDASESIRGNEDDVTRLASELERSFVDEEKNPDSFRTAVENQRSRMQRLLQGETATLIRSGENVAAFSGSEQIGTWTDGRTVYELGSVVVLPEFRGRGLSSTALQRCIKEVREQDQQALFMVFTRDQNLIGWCKKREGMQLTPEELIEIYRRGGNEIQDEEVPGIIKNWEGYSLYLVDAA